MNGEKVLSDRINGAYWEDGNYFLLADDIKKRTVKSACVAIILKLDDS